MELFLSYRYVNWPFAHQLAQALRSFIDATIFVDYQSVDEPNFEASILSHLRKSDAVLLIVSKDTFEPGRIHRDDDWVRREIREALIFKKPIVVVLVDGQLIPTDIPRDILAVRGKEGIKFYPEYFDAGVQRLTNFIVKATPLRSAFLDDGEDETKEAQPYGNTTLADVVAALDQKDYDRALLFLEEMRDNGYASQVVSIGNMIADAQQQRDTERRQQEARAAYHDIAALARGKVTREWARDAWKAFQIAYSDFNGDAENLAEKLGSSYPSAPAPFRTIVPPATKEIGEIIVSGSDISLDALSLDDILNYFADTPVDAAANSPVIQPPPDAKKGASSESARITQEAKQLS